MGWKMGLMDYAGGAYPAVQAYLAAKNNKQKQQESAARMALEQRRMALEEQRLQALMNAQKEEQMLKAGMRNAILGAVEPSRDYASGLMALEQQNPAMVETRQEEVRGMEEPYSYRAATEAGTPALRGLMQGGLNPQKALSAAMPYMEPAQMITAIQNMQNMPLELQNKILNMDVMRSTIKKNESQADKNRRPEEPKKFDWDALITGGKYTPESIEDAKLAGDPRKLKFVEKPDTTETWGEPYETTVGGKKIRVQKSNRGQERAVGQDVSTTVKVDTGNRFKDAVTLRKEFNNLPEIKEYNTMQSKFSAMEKAMQEAKSSNNLVAVDQALISLYNKLTDPSSVVRESEYARTAENIPLLNQIKGKADKVMRGGAGLTNPEREALMRMARLMKQGYEEIRQRRVLEYHSYATDYGIDPNTVIRDVATQPESGSSKPKRMIYNPATGGIE
jgi:hypothetical protein